jgi:hypothetical protein
MMTRSLMVLLSVGFSWSFLQLSSRLRGRHALFPPRGEEKEEGEAEARHVRCAAYQSIHGSSIDLGAPLLVHSSSDSRVVTASPTM